MVGFFMEVLMLRFIKQIFCWHSWEHDFDINGDAIKECRKCEKVKPDVL